jgi:hypothetical protein
MAPAAHGPQPEGYHQDAGIRWHPVDDRLSVDRCGRPVGEMQAQPNVLVPKMYSAPCCQRDGAGDAANLGPRRGPGRQRSLCVHGVLATSSAALVGRWIALRAARVTPGHIAVIRVIRRARDTITAA